MHAYPQNRMQPPYREQSLVHHLPPEAFYHRKSHSMDSQAIAQQASASCKLKICAKNSFRSQCGQCFSVGGLRRESGELSSASAEQLDRRFGGHGEHPPLPHSNGGGGAAASTQMAAGCTSSLQRPQRILVDDDALTPSYTQALQPPTPPSDQHAAAAASSTHDDEHNDDGGGGGDEDDEVASSARNANEASTSMLTVASDTSSAAGGTQKSASGADSSRRRFEKRYHTVGDVDSAKSSSSSPLNAMSTQSAILKRFSWNIGSQKKISRLSDVRFCISRIDARSQILK